VAIILLAVFVFFSWVWSIFRGFEISFLCAILCFLFPPFAQIFFSLQQKTMRMPLFCLLIGGFILQHQAKLYQVSKGVATVVVGG
jgi:hypothetical protein